MLLNLIKITKAFYAQTRSVMSVNLFKKIIGCQQLSYINFYYIFSIKCPALRDLTVPLVKNKVKKRWEE